jgi:hypothetical protein
MSKKIGLALTLTLMLLLLISMSNLDMTRAQSIWSMWGIPAEPINAPPTISISFPTFNETFISPLVTIDFKINEPEQWFEYNASVGTPPYIYTMTPYPHNLVAGNITSVHYILNGERQNLSVPVLPALRSTNGSLSTYLSYSIPLHLTNGQYALQVFVEGSSFYMPNIFTGNISEIDVNAVSQLTYFTVKSPQPIIIAPERMTYDENSVPFQFTTGGLSASWIGYSLDSKTNVTITGNTTLTGLTNGKHYLIVYTNDTLGNSYAFQTVYFTIKTTDLYLTIAVIAIPVAMVCLIAVLLLFRRHRKNSNINQ